MKQYFLVGSILILCLFIFSCSKEDKFIHDSDFIGSWEIEGSTRIYTQEDSLISSYDHPRNRTARFTEDHKYEYRLSVPDQNILLIDSANWKLQDDLSKLEIDVFYDNNEHLIDIWEKEYVIDTISNDIIKFHYIAINCSAQGFDNVICEHNYIYHRI